MERDKQCPLCKRTYRGEGYAGLCTELCFESTRTKGDERKRILSEIKGNDEFTKSGYQKKITKSNRKWLKKVEISSPAPSKYAVLEKMLRKELYKDGDEGGWTKKYNGVRG